MAYVIRKEQDGHKWTFSKFVWRGAVQSVQGMQVDRFAFFDSKEDAERCLQQIERVALGFRVTHVDMTVVTECKPS